MTPRPIATLTLPQARAVHLAAQGLLAPPKKRATRATVLGAIARMRVLQIDTIHVVARSPYLVLFSRVGSYRPEILGELLEEGRIFECWAHEACFAPIEDYAVLARSADDRTKHWARRHAEATLEKHREPMHELLERIRKGGPVRSADLGSDEKRKSGGFWQWKPEKRWLEAWFALGELMIAKRDGFQRVYDLRERVLARARGGGEPGPLPSIDEARRELTIAAVRALGVTPARFVDDYFRTPYKTDARALDALVDEGALARVEVRGLDGPAYVHADQIATVARAARGALRPTVTTLLSPFDPVVWDRRRAKEMFGFDYRLECYTPAPKRIHGYYVLPILHRGKLVGRVDAKAHREDGVFEVKSISLEPDPGDAAVLAVAIARALSSTAAWHRTPRVVVTRADSRKLLSALRSAVRERSRASEGVE